MKTVRVTYTAQSAFVQQNTLNIQAVMSELHQPQYQGVTYFTTLNEDGKTFTHTTFFKTDADHQLLLNLPAFKYFQQELKAKGLEIPPKQESLTFIGSSKDFFTL